MKRDTYIQETCWVGYEAYRDTQLIYWLITTLIVRYRIGVQECDWIIAVLARIHQQRREERDVGGCQTKYMIISRIR